MDKEEIENLRKIYNKEHPNEPAIVPGTIHKVWKEIKKRLHSRCKDKTECILASFINKPKAPKSWSKNPEEWLSSIEIEKIEKEFMRVFKKYVFLGSIPIDFDKKSETGKCIVDSLCSMNISKIYREGYEQIGIVFNTDVSTGPGQHWVAVFLDIGSKYEFSRMTYFDSYSQKPEPEIQRLMLRWKEQWDSLGINEMKLNYNKVRHQYKDSECGMYCIYFHYCCLMNIPMDKRVPDDVVNGFRRILFS